MATYQITAPGGATYKIDGPDGADPSQIIQQITGHAMPKQFDAIGGKAVPVGSAEDIAAQSPVSGNSGAYNALLGWQRGVRQIGRGVGQDLGLVSRQDIANDRQTDAPLMQTTGGKIGNFLGQTNALFPAAFIPGANTVTGAAGVGALAGLAQPSTSTGDTFRNIGWGAAGGAGGVLAGRALGVSDVASIRRFSARRCGCASSAVHSCGCVTWRAADDGTARQQSRYSAVRSDAQKHAAICQ